MNKEGLPPTLR